jgi:WD40 repeat protein
MHEDILLTDRELEEARHFSKLIHEPQFIEYINDSKRFHDQKREDLRKQDKQRFIHNCKLVAISVILFSIVIGYFVNNTEISTQKAHIAEAEKNKARIESDNHYALLLQEEAIKADKNRDVEKARHFSIEALSKTHVLNTMPESKYILSKYGLRSNLIGALNNRANRKYYSINNVFDVKNNKISLINKDNLIVVKNIISKNEIVLYGHKSKVIDVKFHPKIESLLFSIDENGEFIVWDLSTSKPLYRQVLKTNIDTSSGFTISNNGKYLALFFRDQSYIWDLSSTQPFLHKQFDSLDGLFITSISDDAEKLIGKTHRDELVVYSLKEKKVINEFSDPNSITSNALFINNSEVIYAEQENIVVFNTLNKSRSLIKLKGSQVKLIKKSTEKNIIYLLNRNGKIITLELTTKTMKKVFQPVARVVDFKMDGEVLYSIDSKEKAIHSMYKSHYHMGSVVKSNDGRYFGIAIGREVEIWDVDNQTFSVLKGGNSLVDKIAFTVDTKVMVMYRSRAIKIWDKDGSYSIEVPKEKLPSAKGKYFFSTNGMHYIIFESRKNIMHVTDLKTYSYYSYQLPSGALYEPIFTYISNESKMAFKVLSDGKSLWYEFDLEQGVLSPIPINEMDAKFLSYSKGGEFIAALISEDSKNYLVILNNEFKEIKRLKIESKVIGNTMTFSSDNRFLVSASSYGKFFKWDIDNNTFTENSLGARNYYPILFKDLTLGRDRNKLYLFSFHDVSEHLKSTLDFRLRVGVAHELELKLSSSPLVADSASSVHVLDAKYYSTGNKVYQFTEYLYQGNKTYTPVIRNTELEKSYALNIAALPNEEIQRIHISRDGIKVVLFYPSGYLFYNLTNNKYSFYKSKFKNDSKVVFFTVDNLYAIIGLPSDSVPFKFVNLNNPELSSQPKLDLFSNERVKFSYHIDNKTFIISYSQSNRIYIFCPEKNIVVKVKHFTKVKDTWFSKIGENVIVKTEDNQYISIFIKPYLMGKEDWDDLSKEYTDKSLSYIDELKLRIKQ